MSRHRFVIAAVALLLFQRLEGQELTVQQNSNSEHRLPVLVTGGSWHYSGAPPSPQSPASRLEQWPMESESFRGAFETLQRDWTGEAIDTPSELRAQVLHYEDLVRTVTDAGGYALVSSNREMKHRCFDRDKRVFT